MVLGTHRIVGFCDFALLVNDVTDPFGVARLGVIARAVGEADGTGGVAEKRIGELIFLGKGRVVGHRVETHAQDFDVATMEFVDLVAEPAAFRRSARGVGFGVKPEEHFLPSQTRESQGVAFVRRAGEIWSWVANA
jgi:hypothetical protein